MALALDQIESNKGKGTTGMDSALALASQY